MFPSRPAGGSPRLAAELGGDPARVVFADCYLTDIEGLRASMAHLRGALGSAHILVNNAANDQRDEAEQLTMEGRMIQVNLRRVSLASQTVVPEMRERGRGLIMNMSSAAAIAGHLELPTTAPRSTPS